MRLVWRYRLYWAAAVLLLLAELMVASLVLRPDVDPIYRAYYIDHSSDCWPHATSADYVPGTTLSFVYGGPHPFDANKICGWFYPSEHGTWSYGDHSLMRFRFAPTGGPMILTVVAGAMVNIDGPVQQVTISTNGSVLATLSFDTVAPETRTATIPAELAAASATGLQLRFDYPDARPGDELGPNEDPHLRAIQVVSLTLAPG